MNGKPVMSQAAALSTYLIFTPLISLAIPIFLPLPVIAIALLMLLIPSSLAILLTAWAEGRKGVGELLRKLLEWRIHLKWYAIALGLAFGILVASRVLAVLLGWAPAFEFSIPERSMLIINSVFIPLVAILEELGWRGYALPRLLMRRSPLMSALIIGVAHGILHLGLGLVDGRPLLPTFLIPLTMSFIWTWLFLQTRGSLTMAILFHFAIDYFPQFLLQGLTVSQSVWAQTIISIIVAFALILLFGRSLQQSPSKGLAVADATGQ